MSALRLFVSCRQPDAVLNLEAAAAHQCFPGWAQRCSLGRRSNNNSKSITNVSVRVALRRRSPHHTVVIYTNEAGRWIWRINEDVLVKRVVQTEKELFECRIALKQTRSEWHIHHRRRERSALPGVLKSKTFWTLNRTWRAAGAERWHLWVQLYYQGLLDHILSIRRMKCKCFSTQTFIRIF